MLIKEFVPDDSFFPAPSFASFEEGTFGSRLPEPIAACMNLNNSCTAAMKLLISVEGVSALAFSYFEAKVLFSRSTQVEIS
jgi:hypothetical protein